MSNQSSPPRNNPDAVATDRGWRHPQTGELLVSVRGLEVKKELRVTTSELKGPQPLSVTVSVAGVTSATIHWGDGSPDESVLFTLATQPVEASHSYPNIGDCTLKVTGTFADGTSETVSKLVKINAPGAKRGPKPKVKDEAPEAK